MTSFSRRAFLVSAAALGAGSSLSLSTPMAATPSRSLTIGMRNIEVLGRSASVFSLLDERGESGLELGPAEDFRVALRNDTEEPTSIHWHGQIPVPEQDGVADTGYVPPLARGKVAEFNFVPRPGTHWMHSHHLLQEQKLLAAPLIVRTSEDLAGDYQEVVVLLHDFTFRDPAEILQELTGMAGMDH
jgi:FtsP/CotA-like multicopper oxidase with cupredoxin domain